MFETWELSRKSHGCHKRPSSNKTELKGLVMWDAILWIAAVIIGIFGVIRIIQKDILWGVVLIVVALLIGPGGVSLFT